MRYLFLQLALVFSIISGVCHSQASKVRIEKNDKGHFCLVNTSTGKAFFKKSKKIVPLSSFDWAQEKDKKILLIEKGSQLIIYNSQLDQKIASFYYRDQSHLYGKHAYSAELVDMQGTDEEMEAAKKRKNKPRIVLISDGDNLGILFNLETLKLVYDQTEDDGTTNIWSAHYTADYNLIKLMVFKTNGLRVTHVLSLNGDIITEPTIDSFFQDIDSKHFIVSIGRGYGLIRADGKLIMGPFYSLEYLRNGHFFAEKFTGNDFKLGVVNFRGETVIPFLYEKPNYVSGNWSFYTDDGLFVMYMDCSSDDFSIIDTNNNILVQPGTYSDINLFRKYKETSYFVLKDHSLGFGRKGIYDSKAQKVIVPCLYNFSGVPMSKTIRIVEDSNTPPLLFAGTKEGWGIIDLRSAQFTIPTIYSSLKKCTRESDDALFYIANSEEKYGVISLTNDTLIPFNYDGIMKMTNDFYLVEKDGLYGVIDLVSHEIVVGTEYTDVTDEWIFKKPDGGKLTQWQFEKGELVRIDD